MASKKIAVDISVNQKGNGVKDATNEIAQLTEQIKKLTELQEKNAGSSNKIADSIDKLTKKLDSLNASQKKANESSSKRKNALTDEERGIVSLIKAETDLAFAKTEEGKQLDIIRAKRAEQRKANIGVAESVKEVKEEVEEEVSVLSVQEEAYKRNDKAYREFEIAQQSVSKSTAELKAQTADLNKTNKAKADREVKNIALERELREGISKEVLETRALELQVRELRKTRDKAAAAHIRQNNTTKEGIKMSLEQQKQMRTTAGLSGALITELGRVASDAQYGLRGMGNNISQVMTLFGLFQANVIASGRTMGQGFRELGKDLLGPVGVVTGLQILLALMSSDKVMTFVERLIKGITALTTFSSVIKDASKNAGTLIGNFRIYTKVLQDANRTSEEKAVALKKLNEEYPKFNASVLTDKNNTEAATKAREDYIEILKKQAISQAAMDKFVESQSKVTQKGLERQKKIQELGLSSIEEVNAEIIKEQAKVDKITSGRLKARASRRLNQLKNARDIGKKVREEEAKVQDFLFDLINLENEKTDKDSKKRVSIYKQTLISFAREQLKFDQDLLATTSRTEQEILTEQGEASKKSILIKRDEFIKKEKLRLEDFLKRKGLTAKQISDAKDVSAKVIKSAEDQAKGVIQTIDKVTEARKKNALAIQELNQRRRGDAIEESDASTALGFMAQGMAKVNAEAELDQLRYDNKVARAKELLALETTTEEQRRDIKRDMTLWEDEKRKTDLENEINIIEERKRVQDEYIGFISGVSGILQGISNKNREWQKASLVLEKGIAIAQVVTEASKSIGVQTASAASYAAQTQAKWAGVPGGTAIASGFVAKNNLKTAKNIAKTKVGAGISIAGILSETIGGLTSINTSSGGGASSGATTVQPPDFNIIGSSNVNQLADAIGSTEKQPVKAYVVSTEVTTEQALNRNTRSSAEL